LNYISTDVQQATEDILPEHLANDVSWTDCL